MFKSICVGNLGADCVTKRKTVRSSQRFEWRILNAGLMPLVVNTNPRSGLIAL